MEYNYGVYHGQYSNFPIWTMSIFGKKELGVIYTDIQIYTYTHTRTRRFFQFTHDKDNILAVQYRKI